MRVDIQDAAALQAISPSVLSAYARAAGWSRLESYRDHSDVYTAAELPEIILPRTTRLGDYSSVVLRLIKIFARVAERDELSLYRDLVISDRDIIRVRVAESADGSLTINNGVDLVDGARDMLLAAACSLREPRPLYRAGANIEATGFVNQVRLGQTEQGSFVVTLLTPVVPPPVPALFSDPEDRDAPIGRRITRRLTEALGVTRKATEKAASGDISAFDDAVTGGVSANLCEALVKLIGPFPTLDVGVTWARTRPMTSVVDTFRFGETDVPILNEAARGFRSQEPQLNRRVFGIVRRLRRDATEDDGTIALKTSIDGKSQSVVAVLSRSDYQRAVRAHGEQVAVVLEGDLERDGQRWRLLNPRLVDAITDEDTPEEV
jgi:hypothetical protein